MSYKYELRRSVRRTLSIEIKPDKTIIIRAPKRLPMHVIEDFAASRETWVNDALKRIEKRASQNPPLPKFTDSELKKMAKDAKIVLPPLVDKYSKIIGVSVDHITIRHQRTRWGSCSADGNLNFNCLLMLTPEYVYRYVVIHELCHRLEMNHSAAFWALVAKYCPDYKEARKYLKAYGSALISRL